MAGPWERYSAPAAASPADGPWSRYGASSVENGRENTVTVRSAGAPEKDGVMMDVAKSAGVGLGKGFIGLSGLPGDIAEYGARGIDHAARFVGDKIGVAVPAREARDPTYGSADIQSGIETVTGPFRKPQTMAGEYAQTIGEFAPGALIGPGGAAARAAQVVVPALASETGGQLTKGTAAEPWARGIGALGGGVAAAIASRPSTAARSIRNALPEGVTPQMVDDAERLVAQAQQQGIDLAWPEALSQVAGRPVLTNMMRHLEASPQTEGRMAEFFGQRPQQVETAARGQFDNIAPVNNTPSQIGPAVGREAEGFAEDVRGAINTASQPYYDAASQVLIPAADMARVRAVPGYAQAARAIADDPQLARYVANLPENSVGYVNEIKKWLDAAAENASSPVTTQGRNMQRSAGFSQDATTVRDIGRNASVDYDTALGIQQGGREQILQPILDGPIGRLAQRDISTKNAIDALFPAQPIANSQQEIGQTVATLAQRSPRVARDLVRSYVEGVFNRTAKDLQSGPNQAGGAKFRAALVGDAQQAANLESAVTALPNGAERWQGFNRLLEVLEATGTRQGVGSRTAYNEQLLKSAGQGGLVSDAVKTGANPFKAGQKLIDRYERWKLGRDLDGLARIMTDPGSANMLRGISRMPANSGQAQAVALRLVTQVAASR